MAGDGIVIGVRVRAGGTRAGIFELAHFYLLAKLWQFALILIGFYFFGVTYLGILVNAVIKLAHMLKRVAKILRGELVYCAMDAACRHNNLFVFVEFTFVKIIPQVVLRVLSVRVR